MFCCILCNYSTDRKYCYNRHQTGKMHLKLKEEDEIKLKEEEDEKENIFNCKKCSKSYKTENSYIMHEMNCNGIGILTCPKCLKTFKYRPSKSKHIKNNNCKAKILSIFIPNNTNYIIINDVIITSRIEDNYINAILLCKAGGIKFDRWYKQESTIKFIKELYDSESKAVVVSDTWIHPDLAIQLAQWISPNFALEVNKWIRSLLSNDKDKKIKLLENTYVKKQTRTIYKETNVIYMLTTKDYKDKRIYIIGKTTNLTNRLSTYNKTIDHEVVYYKSCNDKTQMTIVENMILIKLNKYSWAFIP